MTNQPNIELKSIDVHVGLSEETPAYTAKLYVDGKHFADVSNQGHGGPDMVYAVDGEREGLYEKIEELEQVIAATFPKHDMSKYGMDDSDESLECICHTLVWEHVDQRNVKSRLSRTIFFRKEDGGIYSVKGKKSPKLLELAAEKFGKENILNLMKFEDAFELFTAV